MPGRHSASHERSASPSVSMRYGVLLVLGLIVIAGGVFAAQRVLASSGCDTTTSYTVAADPTIAPALSTAVAATPAEDIGCVQLTVAATDSARVAAAVTKGADVPQLWVPDSSAWISRVSRSTGQLVDVASQSVAASPVVIAAQNGQAPFFDSWLTALQLQGFRLGNPLDNTVSQGPVYGAIAEGAATIGSADAVSAALVPVAQAQAATAKDTDSATRLSEVASAGGVAVASEQQVVAYTADTALTATVPQTGAFVLNFPVAVTAAAGPDHDAAKEAGVTLAEIMQSEAGVTALSNAGFRTPDVAALTDGRGVGDVTPLVPVDQDLVARTMQKYAVLAMPSRTLVMEDVSGSMAANVGGDTRVGLTVKASETGNRLFPDNASMGLWAFSVGLGGGSQDYRELVPIRRMDAPVDGTTQREVLLDATRGLPTLVGGGTGLYDTTLAAFRQVKDGYDPAAINSVIILTDGSNEDDGSMSLDTLLETLRTEQDPAKPVIVVTIGITADADAGVLQQISAATGGTSFVARNPAEIPNVFVNAMKSRAGG